MVEMGRCDGEVVEIWVLATVLQYSSSDNSQVSTWGLIGMNLFFYEVRVVLEKVATIGRGRHDSISRLSSFRFASRFLRD